MQLQGQDSEDVDHLGEAKVLGTKLNEKEQALLALVKVLTLEPAKTRDAHVERMREVGWNDEQIFETSFVTAMFAFYNRMADAYGMDYIPGRWFPPDLRPSATPTAPVTPNSKK